MGLMRKRTVCVGLWCKVNIFYRPGHVGGRFHQFKSSLIGQVFPDWLFESGPSNQKTIDFVGAFNDSVDPGVSVGAFCRVFGGVTGAIQNLNPFIHTEVKALTTVYFGRRTPDGILFYDRGGFSCYASYQSCCLNTAGK